MADKYLQPVNDHFSSNIEDDYDIDDDIFLSNSRTNSSSGEAAAGSITTSTNPFDDSKQQTFEVKKRELESRTLASTQNSLSLLYETEEVGKATAIELAKQGEQLKNTARQLDEINSSLLFSQRHLNSLKSVFGGLKNYLAGNRDTQSSRMTNSPSGSHISTQPDDLARGPSQSAGASCSTSAPMSPTERYDNHPVSRIRGDSSMQKPTKNGFESQLESNLEEMCDNLSRLKGLATNLGTEIETQNELLDTMSYNIEDVDIKVLKQNKQMNKILGKK